MSILDTAVNLLNQQLHTDVDASAAGDALTSLLGGDGQGGLDLAGLSTRMLQEGGLGDVLQSWLGDGSNAPINADTVRSLLGDANIAEFARRLNIDPETASARLSDLLPRVVDQASSGGELQAGLGGLLGAAKSFLK